ncbi:DUF2794 domain-containing protein [Enterovirga sp.]|uniref:DUF2794 domain-containing protein n=1 Tax=Enterovirga sp. TaxID=2026350 RepID=UPI002C5C4DD9|nr:DUF2794 domain-containing protein [Enterovirga sp.]HMO29007.1 DUF2794 domain-containing protein [Enterovirga sp.]
MSEAEAGEPIRGGQVLSFPSAAPPAEVTFDRQELRLILLLYGRMVAEGEWRDYGIDFNRERAVFSVYRRSSEVALYRIVKEPRLARRQGAYAVSTGTGMILKRGHDLARVLRTLETPLKLVTN